MRGVKVQADTRRRRLRNLDLPGADCALREQAPAPLPRVPPAVRTTPDPAPHPTLA